MFVLNASENEIILQLFNIRFSITQFQSQLWRLSVSCFVIYQMLCLVFYLDLESVKINLEFLSLVKFVNTTTTIIWLCNPAPCINCQEI